MPRARGKRAIDGDTFEIMDGTRVRISGYDAPELSKSGGQAAKQRLSKLIRGQELGLSKELKKSFDRSVRKVTIKGQPIVKILQKKK